jgi:hypothetical protein
MPTRDTRLIYHLRQIQEENLGANAKYIVGSDDTDALVLLRYHVHNFQVSHRIWMDAGLCGNNTMRYINLNQLLEQMKPVFVDDLPG